MDKWVCSFVMDDGEHLIWSIMEKSVWECIRLELEWSRLRWGGEPWQFCWVFLEAWTRWLTELPLHSSFSPEAPVLVSLERFQFSLRESDPQIQTHVDWQKSEYSTLLFTRAPTSIFPVPCFHVWYGSRYMHDRNRCIKQNRCNVGIFPTRIIVCTKKVQVSMLLKQIFHMFLMLWMAHKINKKSDKPESWIGKSLFIT